MNVQRIVTAAVLAVAFLVVIFFLVVFFSFLRLWIQSFLTGAKIGIFDLIAVWFQLRFGRKPMLFLVSEASSSS